MIKCFLRCYSLFGVHPEHLFEQVEAVLIDLAEVSSVNGFYVVYVRELHADELWVLQEMLMVLGYKGPQALLDEVKLI